MRVLRIALAVVFGLGVLRIGWSFVDSGQLPNPLNDIRSVVSSVGSSVGISIKDTFHPER